MAFLWLEKNGGAILATYDTWDDPPSTRYDGFKLSLRCKAGKLLGFLESPHLQVHAKAVKTPWNFFFPTTVRKKKTSLLRVVDCTKEAFKYTKTHQKPTFCCFLHCFLLASPNPCGLFFPLNIHGDAAGFCH